ncbi:amidohydrolase [uncultured Kriegella sp.]|uniref:amidohydrolase n=1 Tax=uncultured Kriegella sp. TaxID=1798910 RepID=UPI0030DBBA68|tara:strand:+ start:287139 stop:287915 length:777 start_codon:yes stop_codon:yes gene_type:complete
MEERLKIALVQSELVWENPEKNRSHFSEIIEAISLDVDLVVLPEMFTTGFTMNPKNIDAFEGKKTVAWMQEFAAKKNMAITGSAVFFENGNYTNRLFFVEPSGNVSHYDKRHTFTLAGEDQVYSAGSNKLIVNYKGFKICPMICYDLRFPVWSRNVENYDVLIYVANWPKRRVDAWDTLLKARAIENMSYCIGVNRVGVDDTGFVYSGHSAAYDALGNQLLFSEKEEVICTTLNKGHTQELRSALKFLDDMDKFTLKG